MFEGKKNFHKSFARVSPVFPLLAVLALLPAVSSGASGPATATVKRQAAESQFERAEEQREALNSRPSEKRTLAEYKQVVNTYRRVYLITPHANVVPESVLAVAELYTEMGNRFGKSYFQSAVDSYLFLVHEYPASKYSQDALLRTAKLQRDELGDPALAAKTYQEFLNRYGRSSRKREAQEALAELSLLRNGEEPKPARAAAVRETPEEPAEGRATLPGRGGLAGGRSVAESREIPHLRQISTKVSEDSTRVIIDLEDSVQYTSARISSPDRIFFDLHAARLTPELARNNIHVSGELLTAVRVAQNQAGVVRVVLDVNGVKDYTASLSTKPPRLTIDLYGQPPLQQASRTKTAKEQPAPSRQEEPLAATREDKAATPTLATRNNDGDSYADGPSAAAATKNALATKNTRSKSLKTSGGKPDLVRPASVPQPMHDGQSSLTRALGLKIGRIVIDAGHGGHDTGTIGPTGLMEKDLCLDVALRLGKIVAQRLPGADVVYTRSDDTFIPLEERTNIANQAKADLFISIHANSSRDTGARGIETYYLNLKGSPEAMEVAARENAVSQESIHDLEDIVKKIARNEKIDESRELAGEIQDSLAKRIQKSSKAVKNRGVRKAPFVVLIGADMPSILTEISFLSNPSDEQLLKKPDYRQRVAEGLYQGMASYLQNMNSVAVNLPPRKPANRSSAMASSAIAEQSGNQK